MDGWEKSRIVAAYRISAKIEAVAEREAKRKGALSRALGSLFGKPGKK